MDFDISEEQSAVEELARTLLADTSTPDRLRALERGSDGISDAEGADRFDRTLWAQMADTGLLGLFGPEDLGGAGLGVVEACLVLREVGRRTAAVPALAVLALGALPIARWGTAAQRAALLPGIGDGSLVVTAALSEQSGDPSQPSVGALREGDRWELSGQRSNVPAGTVAEVVLVPATDRDTTVVVVVPLDAPGVEVRRQDTTSGIPEALITLDRVVLDEDAVLGGAPGSDGRPDGAEVLAWMLDVANVAACAEMAGLCAEAVAITGRYTTEREQFGRPIASFQAVTQRAGDAYVDAQAVDLTMLQAAWRIAAGVPASREVAIAKYWAAAGGQRVVHAAQHLHGGMGVDRDYPLHRYFLLAKQLELFLGGATRQLQRIGRRLAA
ncbi:acyl-CoA dehydrogenase family protein [Dermatobacter hominis]|uniref:acyl-CoA dehydrogenase family protein n=1 Tax=Dermatobacter hominis TaxID=2884263 RepID=UPI001D12A9A3|nr:acyl-CoA dehydrogenase family protein [Dermatobacter hominis]UDY34897.1 acyl-CoA/acyl-ACP dehydrogenase [Dermatobacter hominis]